MQLAEERIKLANLSNVELQIGDIDDFNDPFDLGIALHACGGASDTVLSK
jgi:cyclopropane fatty-acyl-phospholipid synthase-like methyltransferase